MPEHCCGDAAKARPLTFDPVLSFPLLLHRWGLRVSQNIYFAWLSARTRSTYTSMFRFRLGRPQLTRRLVASVASCTAAACGTAGFAVALSDGAVPDMATAQLLRQVGFRARETLQEPPALLQRCARAEWRSYASRSSLETLERSQLALRNALLSAAKAWQSSQTVDVATINNLFKAAEGADVAVAQAKESAVSGAAAVPWGKALSKAVFERADERRGAQDALDASSLNGKIVGLYFTASWCGPCHQFSPYLVRIFENARQPHKGGSTRGFEVVLVSWDEEEHDRVTYAKSHGMKWLALSHMQRDLADLLNLRYNVTSIPSLVVVEISEDGKEARVLAEAAQGRTDVLRGGAEWIERIL